MIRTRFKYAISFMLVLLNTVSLAQTATTISVGGTEDKYYPVTFTDPEWGSGKPTEIYIGRPNVHTDGSLKGSTLASFKYHTTQWGNQSSFIYATIERSEFASFFAGWADATTNNNLARIVIWLKGGGMSYLVKSVSTVGIAVYDGVQNVLPFLEENGPARSYKTTIDSYVITGSMSSSGSLVAGNGTFLANVGVGTSAPAAKVHINTPGSDVDGGNVNIDPNALVIQASTGNRSTTMGPKIEFTLPVNSDGSNPWSLARLMAVAGNSNSGDASGKLILGTRRYYDKLGSGSQWYFGNDLVVDGSGNVGVGTSSPLAKFEVRNGNILVKNLSNTTNESVPMIAQSLSFGPYTTFGTSINTFTESEGNNSYALQFLTQETFQTGPKEKLRISANGNVGIGTATPNEKLAVNGKIRAREIKVEPNPATWPDYVFEADYKHGTLEELERYIKAHKHLPEMPTVKEVAANGIELGEMNRLLLKKVEELTLHLIEKDKQLQVSNKRLTTLETESETIKELLKSIQSKLSKP